MKRLLCATMLCLTLTACANSETESTENTTTTVDESTEEVVVDISPESSESIEVDPTDKLSDEYNRADDFQADTHVVDSATMRELLEPYSRILADCGTSLDEISESVWNYVETSDAYNGVFFYNGGLHSMVLDSNGLTIDSLLHTPNE